MATSVASALRITIATPAPRGSRNGNRVTALRWAGLLRQLGHRVRLINHWTPHEADVLIAVHAVKSADAVSAATAEHPELPVVVLLAGTDIYPQFAPGEAAQHCLARADLLIALQPHALDILPTDLLRKTRTIVQSATTVATTRTPQFSAVVLAHLREVKHPLLAIESVAQLPAALGVELTLAGGTLETNYAASVEAAVRATPNVDYLGEVSRRASKQLMASRHVCIVPSRHEGGANVVSEAIAAGTPVLCSRIPGNLGLLGDDWPATFEVDDVAGLRDLLQRAATDASFLEQLRQRTRALQPQVSPAREREQWRDLLNELRTRRFPSNS